MKKIFLLFFIVLNMSYTHAQTNNRDSIKQLLQKEKTDTGRVQLLADLCFEYFESNPDTAMVLALEALSLARQTGFKKGEAISLNRVANAYDALANYPKGMEVLLQALKINEKINNQDGIQRNYNNMGVIYIEQEDFRQALDYLLKARQLGEKNEDRKAITSTLVNLALVYQRLKIYDSARFYGQECYETATRVNYSRGIGSSLHRLGNINFETGKNVFALEYYRSSIPFSKQAKNDLRLSETFLDIAKLFENIGQNDSVLLYARQSLSLARDKGFTKHIRDAGRFLSSYYRNKRIQDSAYLYQDVTKAANDSLFSQQKQRQIQSLSFDEKLRQQEIVLAEQKAKEERNHNLQYAAIAVGLITFIILFLVLSRSIIVKQKFIEFFAILGLLAVFEFINLFIHPYLVNITNNSPVLMLIILISIGALLIPFHHKLEKWITKIMIEKNKKIRLEAAKKTIRLLSDEQIE